MRSKGHVAAVVVVSVGPDTEVIIDEEVDIDPEDFWHALFPARAGDSITIVARNLDEYNLDVFLLHEEDVDDEEFMDTYALLRR